MRLQPVILNRNQDLAGDHVQHQPLQQQSIPRQPGDTISSGVRSTTSVKRNAKHLPQCTVRPKQML
ncbi:conserved hypothetical protein [Culex quinquefasciatus]|uniref:Uncharacterized protein n=1 Tax=Culex quinquefasciatus TaxID=7176 RepID=B0XGT5_CULQU|nr:conserved hypothetical protein [Culex quinquefasciatus]|eukprot:XP_001868857.1 conserved hypothetical protein [Culex quinquefasciatus]